MTFNLSLFLHEVLYTAYLLASWLCLTWLIRFVELVCCALFSSFCFELYNSFNNNWGLELSCRFLDSVCEFQWEYEWVAVSLKRNITYNICFFL